MKNIIRAACIGLVIVTMVGCSKNSSVKENEKDITVCKGYEYSTSGEVEMSFESENDKISKQIMKSTIVIGDMSEKEMLSRVKDEADTYNAIKGVTYVAKKKDQNALITLTVDFDKADFDELLDEGVITAPGKVIKYISLKETVKALKDKDYTCKTK